AVRLDGRPGDARRPDDPGGARREPLPLHRLPEHRHGSAARRREDPGMRLVDLTHRFSIHTPGWVGYPSPKLSYFQRHATQGIVSQYLETPLHAGTHFDG